MVVTKSCHGHYERRESGGCKMKHKQNEPIFLINSIGNLDNSVDPEKAKAAIEAKKKENEESGEEKIDKKDDSKEKIEENYRTY